MLTVLLGLSGCYTTHSGHGSPSIQTAMPAQSAMPRELSKVVLPPYTIEPPDILLVDEVHLVPRSPYELKREDVVRITVRRGPADPLKEGDLLNVELEGVPLNTSSYKLEAGDVLGVQAFGVLRETPIDTQFQVQPDGRIRLRVTEFETVKSPEGQVISVVPKGMEDYGWVPVGGLTVEEAEQAIQKKLAETFRDVTVVATLLKDLIRLNEVYQVHRTGEILLPLPYGRIPVANQSIVEAEQSIIQRVSLFLYQPVVRVTLTTDAPFDGSFLVEQNGKIDLNHPVQSLRVPGAGVNAILHFNAGPMPGVEGGPVLRQVPGETAQAQAPGPQRRTQVFYEQTPVVAGSTIEVVEDIIREHLKAAYFEDIEVSVTLEQMAARQQIIGEHLVTQDGTVTLGAYGSVPVVGLTLAQAKLAIENYLSRYFEGPEVSVNVFAYNSKKYTVITQGAGLGDQMYQFPITGNETVLDAIAQINGLSQLSSKRIWIARPTPEPGKRQILPVSWEAITAQGSPATNYQILPGDRIFIAEDKLIAFDTALAKLTAPLERIMGFTLLGVGTVTRFSGPVLKGGGNRGRGGIGF